MANSARGSDIKTEVRALCGTILMKRLCISVTSSTKVTKNEKLDERNICLYTVWTVNDVLIDPSPFIILVDPHPFRAIKGYGSSEIIKN